MSYRPEVAHSAGRAAERLRSRNSAYATMRLEELTESLELLIVSILRAADGRAELLDRHLARMAPLRREQGLTAADIEAAFTEYLIFSQIGKKIADKYGILDPKEYQYASWEDVFNGMRATAEGKGVGIDQITPAELASLGTNGVQEPFKRTGNTLVGTERMYEDKFATADGKARFVAHDYTWTAADPLAFLPEEVKPNAQYPLFVTTVRYQTSWQSGYTYRWLKQLPQRSVPFMEFVVNPQDAAKAGVKDGDWAELSNQYSATQGVVNVSDQVPPGVVSAIFGWQGPSDSSPNGDPQYYANNLVAGGANVQQKSNGAFYKNTRGALRKLDKAPRTAQNTPGLSEKDRYGHVKAAGVDGNPKSTAKNFVSVTLP